MKCASDKSGKVTQALCPVCSVRLKTVWQEGDFAAKRCLKCGLILSRSPTSFSFDEQYFQRHVDAADSRIHHFRQMIASLPVKLKAPILDVGAGVGLFIRALPPDLAYATTLVEPSGFARRYLSEMAVANVFSSLADIPPDHAPFATVTFWDVLAHVESPVEMLIQTKRLMINGGLLVIKTPYHPLRLFRVARLLGPIRKGRSLLHIPSMRTHFTPESLHALLRATGFRVLSWQWTSEPPLVGQMGLVLLKGALERLVKWAVTGKGSFITIAISKYRDGGHREMTP